MAPVGNQWLFFVRNNDFRRISIICLGTSYFAREQQILTQLAPPIQLMILTKTITFIQQLQRSTIFLSNEKSKQDLTDMLSSAESRISKLKSDSLKNVSKMVMLLKDGKTWQDMFSMVMFYL